MDEVYKFWVLKSASKKWKDFKAYLKRKYYKPNLSTATNILNGCNDRIPGSQWQSLVRHWKSDRVKVLSELNKIARKEQQNGTHTAGSRSFAVVQNQLVIYSSTAYYLLRKSVDKGLRERESANGLEDTAGPKVQDIQKVKIKPKRKSILELVSDSQMNSDAELVTDSQRTQRKDYKKKN